MSRGCPDAPHYRQAAADRRLEASTAQPRRPGRNPVLSERTVLQALNEVEEATGMVALEVPHTVSASAHAGDVRAMDLSEDAVSLRGLIKHFGQVRAVDSLSLE